MVLVLIKCLSNMSSIIPGDTFAFSVSDENKRARVQDIADEFMDRFRIVSFVHDIEIRASESVTLFKEFFGVRDIMDLMLGYLEASDNLPIGIDRDRCFYEPFSGFTRSPGIVVTGV
jgi:hypothetical protein